MAHWLPHLDDRWDDPAGREVILDSVRAIEAEPSLLGLGPHLLLTARVPA